MFHFLCCPLNSVGTFKQLRKIHGLGLTGQDATLAETKGPSAARKIVSRNLQFAKEISIFCTATQKNNNMLQRCVSGAIDYARTRMAQAKVNRLIAATAGAGLALTAAFMPLAATAQEVTPASTSENTAWTEELRAFDKAAKEARGYAEDNYGVGILIHVGEDFPNAHFQTPEQFAQAVVGMFEQHLGTPAQAFLRPNPGTKNTGLTYHIGHLIHGAENGTEVKTVQEAIDTAPDVVEQLKLLKDIASLEVRQASLDNN